MTHFNPALVLNADYTPLSQFPLSLLPWQKAIKGIFKGAYYVVAEYDEVLRGSIPQDGTTKRFEMNVPSVIVLKKYQNVGKQVAFTRFNVFLRDDFQCQYCGAPEELTFDHVVPRSKGGQTNWENIVAACADCNTEKGHHNRMAPLMAPRKPTIGELRAKAMKYPPNYLHHTWRDYLHWNTELET